ncbi:skeletor, partial [Nephila pilipes]
LNLKSLISYSKPLTNEITSFAQCFTHRQLGWKINIVDSCDNLRHEASIQHVKNVTYNSLASDYKRGGEKKKLFYEDETPQYPRNDGIPLILEDPSHEIEPQRELHSTPRAYEPPTTSEKSTVYFNMSPSPRGKQTFFVTTHHPKVLSKYSTPRPHKVVTMETFQLGDVVPSIRHRGNYHPQRPVTDHPTRGHEIPPQHRPQWWNDPSKNQAVPRPTVNTLRHQLSVLQKTTPESVSPPRNPSHRPRNTQKKIISVVVNNDAKFHSQGSAPGRTFAVINTEQKNLVPLLVVSPKQTSRPRNDGKRPAQRIKGGSDYITSASHQIMRHAHPSNGSIRFDSRNVPLVPVVLEKNGNNFYSLQNVLSLLNQGSVGHSRRTRSADHHPGHHEHEHNEHEHEHHHDDEMSKKESSKKSTANGLSLSVGLVLMLSILNIFFRRV